MNVELRDERTIDLEEFMDKDSASLGAIIDDIEPFLAAKNSGAGLFDEEELKKLANQLQVTMRDKVKIFDLNAAVEPDNAERKNQNPPISGELLATESLLSPQNYVATEQVCATVVERKEILMHEYLKITQLS